MKKKYLCSSKYFVWVPSSDNRKCSQNPCKNSDLEQNKKLYTFILIIFLRKCLEKMFYIKKDVCTLL